MSASDEWTDGERAALAGLPREEAVPAWLTERTVAALQAQGLLRSRRQRPWLLPVAAAAALVAFLFGLSLGQARGTRIGHDLAVAAMTAVPTTDAAALALAVQRTGSMYVQALAALAALPDAEAPAARQAREAALNTTEAALHEVTLFATDTTTRGRLSRTLQRPAGRSVWY